jgi:hypothetical protein
VYGLHSLPPIEYIVLVANGNERNNTRVKVLTRRITKLTQLQEARMRVAKIARIQQWNKILLSQQKNLGKKK